MEIARRLYASGAATGTWVLFSRYPALKRRAISIRVSHTGDFRLPETRGSFAAAYSGMANTYTQTRVGQASCLPVNAASSRVFPTIQKSIHPTSGHPTIQNLVIL